MDLTRDQDFKNIDSMSIEKSLLLFPEQIENSWKDARSANISELEVEGVIVSGMGGSSNAGKILQGIYESKTSIPLEVFNDYGLPSWVNSKTLVVANSYSGNTEETLSAIEGARKVGAQILGVATGGKIADMIKVGEISGAIISPRDTNPCGFPKAGLGVSLGGLAGALSKAGVIDLDQEELFAALGELKTIRESWNAKEIANWLNGAAPVLFGARPLLGAVNAARNAMCEISRNYTQFYDFPEVDHVLIEALEKPEPVKKNKYLFFDSHLYNPRIKKRFEVTSAILAEMGLEYKVKACEGKSVLAQALEVANFSAWLGFYLSMLQNTDPGPEPWIIKLKESLAQPVH